MRERYTTENMLVKRDLILVKDSTDIFDYYTPSDCAKKMNDLERQLEEARKDDHWNKLKINRQEKEIEKHLNRLQEISEYMVEHDCLSDFHEWRNRG